MLPGLLPPIFDDLEVFADVLPPNNIILLARPPPSPPLTNTASPTNHTTRNSYGLLQAASQIVSPGEEYTIFPSGTDMIVTYDCAAEGCSVVAYDPGDSAFIMLCGALIFFMIPGVALLYSGLVRRKNALSLLLLCLLALAITAFQWSVARAFSAAQPAPQRLDPPAPSSLPCAGSVR